LEDIMKTNESAADRIIRVVLGLVLGSLVAFKVVTGAAAIVVGIGAGIVLLTGVVGFCAIYALFGLSTHKGAKSN
jgi:hypothetical protein